ncbi:Hypothetical predicted protein [Podarcis lilfordi]|uniref:Uncharacterized protein n=1 Tax=Podarcis lilfordi TaxID=74358 RepID=A0AA35P3M7_9SAUR|nr:Hypothetical predicted protein [Podarcis lilfordi]
MDHLQLQAQTLEHTLWCTGEEKENVFHGRSENHILRKKHIKLLREENKIAHSEGSEDNKYFNKMYEN